VILPEDVEASDVVVAHVSVAYRAKLLYVLRTELSSSLMSVVQGAFVNLGCMSTLERCWL
jgi:ABC-type microcin C transport system permease subunit YejE